MNVSAEQQQKCVMMHVNSYVLKVCGCEDFLLGNHPISQYKVFLYRISGAIGRISGYFFNIQFQLQIWHCLLPNI